MAKDFPYFLWVLQFQFLCFSALSILTWSFCVLRQKGLILFAHGYPAFLTPIIEETTLSPLYILVTFVEN
jgi:hypothetical protein